MDSKLFHAIVGIGISLGTTSLACSTRHYSRQQADDLTMDEPQPLRAASPVTSSTSEPASTDADAAAPVDPSTIDIDAAVDADSTDAPLIMDANHDAFCDAAWPTTKGTPPAPCQ